MVSVRAGEIFATEAARVEQRDGQRVTECECGGGAGGGCEVERAGFFGDGAVEVGIGLARER